MCRLTLCLSAPQLSERGQARLEQIDDASGRVQDFYRLVAELQALLGRAEEGLNAQGLVGTEVEVIKQQLHDFKVGAAAESVCVCVLVLCPSLFVVLWCLDAVCQAATHVLVDECANL